MTNTWNLKNEQNMTNIISDSVEVELGDRKIEEDRVHDKSYNDNECSCQEIVEPALYRIFSWRN